MFVELISFLHQGSQVSHLEDYAQKVRNDLGKVLDRLGIEKKVGLSDYEGTKRRRIHLKDAGKELEQAMIKQGEDEIKAIENPSPKNLKKT